MIASLPQARLNGFRDELLAHGLLIDTGVPGVYGRSGVFEDTLEHVDRLVGRLGAPDGAEVVRFPPLLNRAHFARSEYLKAFPHLAGSVHAFAGTTADHRALLQDVDEGRDWSRRLDASAVVLTPAACYPVYPAMTGTLPAGGRLFDVMSYCFRHEPSEDAGRMQMFRMHEYVRAGDAQTVTAWREAWIARAMAVAGDLGLEVECERASDPFFGRGGQLLATTQREQRLKLEILAPISDPANPSAIMSLNYHQDHFAALFDIHTADGALAHTSCVGFGLERITLALFRRHGWRRDAWPHAVRTALDLRS